jgi:hypothetical protein
MDDLDVVQWFFDLDRVGTCFNWPVSVPSLVTGKRAIDAAVASRASADEVMEAYKKLASAVGPTVMTSLLQSDDAFPEVNHSGKPTPPADGRVTLYVDPNGKRVLAEVVLTYGVPSKFSVE